MTSDAEISEDARMWIVAALLLKAQEALGHLQGDFDWDRTLNVLDVSYGLLTEARRVADLRAVAGSDE
jgi:hypothetical protein